MHAHVEDWRENSIAIQLAVSSDELAPLLRNLSILRRDAGQHFHISADGPELGRLADIEISVMGPGQEHNMSMTSVAILPGTEITLPSESRRRIGSIQSVAVILLGALGGSAMLVAARSAFVAAATDDYRNILFGGVWASAIALIAFQACGVVAKGLKARVVALIGAAVVLLFFAGIVQRLGALVG